MIPLRNLVVSRQLRFAATLAVAIAACQRREGFDPGTAPADLGTKRNDDSIVDPERAPDHGLERLVIRRDPAAFEPLLRQLHEGETEQSLAALSALVAYDDQRAVQPIIDESERRDFAFFLEALYALGSLGGEQAEAYLETIRSGHADPRARAAAGEALVLAGKRAADVRAAHAEGGDR